MITSKQARRDAKQLFRSCVANGLLDENKVREAVRQVLERRPRGYLPTLAHFQRLVKLDLQRRTARVESAGELSAEMKAQVEKGLAARYGQGLNIGFAVNPALLGGLRIKVGSDVYDGSVKGRLDTLASGF